ncbi:TKL/TKL-ccin protein kinase [Coprinopsis cinerea AmutBmut pab1-1]|nr:TKL/TKL-ccin protein kinase [Coprinopsis cinerea AmutBmut pab1-1]
MDSDTITIAVMGATGSGKSTFINLVSGSSLPTSSGLRSCTASIHETPPFELDGKKIVLIDTPGFDDTTKSDTEILKLIAEHLANSYRQNNHLSGLLFLHRISDTRIGGISSKSFRTLHTLCGKPALPNLIILTTMWDITDFSLAEAREHELASEEMFFKPALEKGARMMRHLGGVESGRNVVRQVVWNLERTGGRRVVLQIQREVVDEGKDVSDTAAAEELDRQMKELKEKQRVEKEKAKAEAEAAMRRQEEEARKQRELEAQRIQEELARAEEERRRVEEDMRRQREELERRMREEEENRRREEERRRREFEERMEALRRREEEENRRRHEEHERLQRELEAQRRRHQHHGGGCSIQ